jgi:photosystem II stability/assembly factor-like uncharacterized protein
MSKTMNLRNQARASLFQPGGRMPALLVMMAVLSAASCDSCAAGGGGGGGGGTSSGGGGSWLVGQSALMLNLDHTKLGELGHYQLGLDDDLYGIACRGTREAWVVGAAGLVISTTDAGTSWTVLDSGVPSALRAVALAAPNQVLIAGDDGVARLSPDGGRHFRALPVPAASFTSVALRRADGGVALLASATGAIFRYDAASNAVAEVVPGSGRALRSIVLSRDGSTAVAVGDGGQMLVSFDGGQSFAPRALGSGADLRDVWLVGPAGERFFAVGEAGLVMEGVVKGSGVAATALPGGPSLRALHMQANGHGMIVGDRGAAYYTDDFGLRWQAMPTGEARDVFGVDALDFGVEHL